MSFIATTLYMPKHNARYKTSPTTMQTPRSTKRRCDFTSRFGLYNLNAHLTPVDAKLACVKSTAFNL
ncbi:hypothetical protein AOR04_17995 [Pseudoalteromonas sp. 1_2015MBL_MicDiv]|nr:hypothetical protein AOR04_17995 [Pseudoalteromonas sp. 1_2015MBL_MicDiv]